MIDDPFAADMALLEPIDLDVAPEPPPRREAVGIRWPNGFRMRSSGLWFDPAGDGKPMRLSGPFRVPGLARDPAGAGWAVLIEWLDRDKRRHRGFISHADLIGEGTEWLRPLVDAGFHISFGRKPLGLFKRALYGLDCQARVRLVRRSGWFNSVFVLPARTIGTADGEEVIFVGRVDAASYAEAGTLEDWVSAVAAPAAGNPRLLLALSVAFAGPIVDLLQDEGGGVNLKGPSSVGKSTLLIAAGSVWGGGARSGFVQTWRATSNGLEGVAKAHSGTVLVLDELGELDAREAGSTAYLLVNGQGKARAAKDAELRPRHEWRVMLLSSGEVGLADKISETGKRARAGQLVRLVDVPADAGRGLGIFDHTNGGEPAAFANNIKAAALRTYGTAGPNFVDVIARNPDGTASAARRMITDLTKRLLTALPEADGQMSRAAHRFALIAVAGEMARVALQLPWADGEVERAIRTCFEAWRSARGGDGPGELVAALDAIRSAIERHGEARFRNLDGAEPSSAPIRNLLGYRLSRGGVLVYAFTATGWSETLAGAADPKSVVGMLFERGLLLTGKDRTHRHFVKVDGRSVPTYAVRASALFDTEDV
ncbi:DUF927 domain-containing protein [Methylobacterium aquaticum]|uniref:DUF927 domain-containing protein n=1 Tax=Methylobacterium aquaticum TaxID=270351 RepID=UPI003D17DF56